MNRPKKFSGLPPGHKRVPVKTVYLEMLRNMVSEPPLPPPGCVIRPWRHPPIED